jgi:hypothetical protein
MGNGTISSDASEASTQIFAQMHYYKFPVWAILDMFTDLPCTEDVSFDIAMMSELDFSLFYPCLALIFVNAFFHDIFLLLIKTNTLHST